MLPIHASTSAAPAITYRLYAEQWHLTYAATTAIFAVYPIAAVATLVIFGSISDQIGRRAAMLWGLGASLAGALLFAAAPDIQWIFAGRMLMGIGVGLSVGPSTAAVLEFCVHQADCNSSTQRYQCIIAVARSRPSISWVICRWELSLLFWVSSLRPEDSDSPSI